jgi:hypothetical protein
MATLVVKVRQYFFRKDGKSFAAISIRRRKGKKGKCLPVFLMETGPKNYITKKSVPLIPYNFGTTTEQL